MTAFQELSQFLRDTQALSRVSMRTGWDQETVMPRGASDDRAEEMAALESILHARRTDPRLPDWLDRAQAQTPAQARILELTARSYARTTRIPARLATELARLTSLSQGVWARARADEDAGAFLPTLSQVVALKREEAQALSDGDPYDALLEDYEPGTTQVEIAQIFDRMRPRLTALLDRVRGAAAQPKALNHNFPADQQMHIARLCATAFGYDWTRGRLDLAVHPFSSGGGNDARITTRVAENDPFNCIYSTIHEVGHACYEQSIDQAYNFTPLGEGVSMGVHESQSRIYENQLGRSAPFTAWLFGQMKKSFGDFGIAKPQDFYATVNRVAPGFIRTESDELQYNLHIMLRFDLERDLIAGRLDVADLEEAWNARFNDDFGLQVDKPSNGFLQDVHWPVGLFGYFPTYALGNVYAGCLNQQLRHAVPQIDTHLERGDASPATAWLREHVQHHGALRNPRDTIAHACGCAPDEAPLLAQLEDKFTAIYQL
ncbi:peptidase M32 [Thioclava sp. SK-1]|uniref:carboxypeptidase M32 n=1 Tax=Thioclava sp. SK-1 TaxID=1889770 RepID=UPI00082525F3|nr:carboxypeptidase M32 [Thioclava sp. SK-1]OCX66143.1 peptidase M32 [Thioclava sp. SK-1]